MLKKAKKIIQEEIKKAPYLLSLDEVEQKRYEAFYHKHYKKHKFRCGCPVTLTPTGIGTHVSVECPHCKKKEDISNYDCW